MGEEIKIFKTDNLALAPFLSMQGLKYVGCDIDTRNHNVYKVVFMFEDPRDIGNEMALDFTNSREKLYRGKYAFFRNEIEITKKKIREK